jgi:hypothetical protein
MNAHTSADWLLFCITLGVLAFFGIIFKRTWEKPLQNGPDFFLGVKVTSRFYEGEGARWLRRWHTVVLAWYSITLFAALAFFISGRWFLFPAWAGGNAALYVASLMGFTSYARTILGANPPVQSSLTIPLQARRLSDYISWRVEALIGAIIAISWVLLLAHGGARTFWEAPVALTYAALCVLPLKIFVARSGVSLPADRPEDHFRWFEAQRRYSLRAVDFFRWLCVLPLAGYALLHGFLAAAWLRWPLIGAFLAVWLYMAAFLILDERRVAKMGHDLLPLGSWSTPFHRAQWMSRGFAVAFGAWFGGLILLLVFFHH